VKSFKRENLFFIVVALFWFAQYLYIPFFSPYLVTFGISTSIVGIIIGSYGFTQLILRIPISIVGSRTGNHKVMIVCGIIGIILSCVFPLLFDNWIGFLITRALAGAASSTWIAYTAYLLEGAEGAANQRMGLLFAANTGGCCASHIVGTIIYGHIGMNLMFVLSICMAFLALILIMLTPFKRRPITVGRTPPIKKNIATVLRNKNFWICSLLELWMQFLIYATILGFTGVFAQEALDVGPLRLGLIAIVCQLCSAATSVVFGKLGRRRLPERGILCASFLLIAAYCALTPACGPQGIILIQVISGVGFGIGNVIPIANAGRDLDDHLHILSMGIFQTIYSIGITVGPAVTGFAFDHTKNDYVFTFMLLSIIAVGGAVVTILAYKNPIRNGQHD